MRTMNQNGYIILESVSIFKRTALILSLCLCCALTRTASGEVYLTEAEALQSIFPTADRITKKRIIFDDDFKQILKARFPNERLPSYITLHEGQHQEQTLGYAIFDDVIGKVRPITYAVGFDKTGTVTQVEIMAYRESHGYQVRRRSWLDQFIGRSSTDRLFVGDDISNITGATLSCRSVTKGVKFHANLIKHLLDRQLNPHNPLSTKTTPKKQQEKNTLLLQKRAQLHMGTNLTLQSDEALHPDQWNRLFAYVRRVDETLSSHIESSEVSQLNRGGAIRPSSLLQDALLASQAIYKLTRGSFDITYASPRKYLDFEKLSINAPILKLPKQVNLDFGGIGKGIALDYLAQVHTKPLLANFGGQVMAIGDKVWPITITDRRGGHHGVLQLKKGSISTSSQEVQPGHIKNSRTGLASKGPLLVSVYHEKASYADALSTALFNMNPQERETFARLHNLDVLIISEHQTRFATGKFKVLH